MTLEEYAKHILRSHDCDEETYGDETAETIVKDLKMAYPKGMDFPYIDVANAIKKMSIPHLISRAPYRVHWSNEHSCDGYDCATFEDAKDSAIETLIEWQGEQISHWKDWKNPTKEELEDYEYMVFECEAFVAKYNPMTDEYEEYWYPSQEDLDAIGWCEGEKLVKMLKEMITE